MKESLWVSMPIIRNIVLYSSRTPRDIETICTAGGLVPADMEKADLKLSLDQNYAIMDAALTISADEYLGLHIGEKTTPSVLGITGHLMESSRDVLSALQNLQQFTTSFTRLYEFRIEIREQEAFYFCEPIPVWNDLSPDTARHSVDICFAGALHILRLLTRHHFRPLAVLYRYPRIVHTEEHERILTCKPQFNQACNCIVFSLKDVSFPIVGYNQELNTILKNILETESNEQAIKTTFGLPAIAPSLRFPWRRPCRSPCFRTSW